MFFAKIPRHTRQNAITEGDLECILTRNCEGTEQLRKGNIMIRFILVAVTVIGFLILSIPLLLIEWIIGKFSPQAKEISSLRIIQAVFKFILWEAGTKVTIIGEENVPKDTPVLYIGNHRSYFDIVLSYSRCPICTGYIAKKEMERYPLLSNWMHYLHCLFLDRKDIKQGLKTILAAIDKVKSGISICISQKAREIKMRMKQSFFHSMKEVSKLPANPAVLLFQCL